MPSRKRVVRSVRERRSVIARVVLILVAVVFQFDAMAAEGSGRQALTTNRLKVCADPANLPFSNEDEEGFENRIVDLLAEELGLEVRYTWYPQSTGFVRNTLRVRECDVIAGITTTSELVQNTNPYYHSAYAMVYRADAGIQAQSLSDPALHALKLGVVAGTPPGNILAAEGLLGNLKPYQLITDTRRARPAEQALVDVASGEIDVAFIWGPIAGYYARQHPKASLVVLPLLAEDKGVRLDFRVSMAVRYNETDWKRTVNRALDARAADIEAVLHAYGVPLLNDRGELIAPPAANPANDSAIDAANDLVNDPVNDSADDPAADPANETDRVPEPLGYRMEMYDAPVPADLEGATTVNGLEVRTLMREQQASVIDVIPEHRRPVDLPEGQLWLPPPHEGIAGAIWLPDTGFGALDPVTESYLMSHLEVASGGNRSHPLVFYCRIDCWMSWNAAKRAVAAGYSAVHWYRDGIDDWRFEDLPMVTLLPAPGVRQPGELPDADADPAVDSDNDVDGGNEVDAPGSDSDEDDSNKETSSK